MDELDEIIVDDSAVNKKLLKDFAKGNFTITKSGDVIFEKEFHERTAKEKIVLFLIARKIMKIKNIGGIDNEKCTESEIQKKTGLPLGTVRTSMNSLKGIVINEGGYYIPNFNINKLSDVIKTQN
jgi:arginine/lysine/ornithine decarboxylase